MKPKALIVDLDNTLALIGDRDPYKGETSDQDRLSFPVYTLIKLYYTYYHTLTPDYRKLAIIIVTGREEKYKEITQNWLLRHGIPTNHIHMRPNGNYSLSSSQLKELILNNAILPEFDPILALEDDYRVAEMYRKNGVPCFQVDTFRPIKNQKEQEG